MMKLFTITLFTLLSTQVICQNSDELKLDSIVLSNDSFWSKVKKVRLAEIEPICEQMIIDSSKNDEIDTAYSNCYPQSVLKCERLNDNYLCELISNTRLSLKSEITRLEIGELKKILYVGEKSSLVTKCYLPRHAIVIYDGRNSIMGIIEICFECHRLKLSSTIPEIELLSHKNFSMLKELFIRNGIKIE